MKNKHYLGATTLLLLTACGINGKSPTVTAIEMAQQMQGDSIEYEAIQPTKELGHNHGKVSGIVDIVVNTADINEAEKQEGGGVSNSFGGSGSTAHNEGTPPSGGSESKPEPEKPAFLRQTENIIGYVDPNRKHVVRSIVVRGEKILLDYPEGPLGQRLPYFEASSSRYSVGLLSYARFGIIYKNPQADFGKDNNPANYVFAVGDKTNLNYSMPTKGRAFYKGMIIATQVKAPSEEMLNGRIDLVADFDQKEIGATFSIQGLEGPTQRVGYAKIDGVNFKGTAPDGAKMQGSFYGYKAQEVAGTIFDGKNGLYAAAFGAHKVKEDADMGYPSKGNTTNPNK